MDRDNIKSVHLPEEIMEEILSRLPVKSLSRFRCVSKSWLSLFNSERFIKTHRHNSTNNKAIIFISKQGVFKQCYLHQLLNEPSSIEPCPIYDPLNDQLLTEALVVGCCNGLLCILNQMRDFHLWNPATMISIELPELKNECKKFGFGWDGKSGAYKVFASNSHRGICKDNVYSSKTSSWKTVEHQHGCLPYNIFGVFACGKIHWIIKISEYYYIESFDLESEEFGRIELPFKPPRCRRQHYKLVEIGGCLHLVCVHDRDYDHDEKSNLAVWVMKGSCWLKLATLTKFLFFEPNCVQVFGGGPNGKIILIFSDNYLIYSPKEDWKLLGAGKTTTRFYEGHVYAESLVSP